METLELRITENSDYEFAFPDVGELIASGELTLSESQIRMLAFMVDLGEDVKFARGDVLPFGVGPHNKRERDFTRLVTKLKKTTGFSDIFQTSGTTRDRVHWFGVREPDTEDYSTTDSEADNNPLGESLHRDLGWMLLGNCLNLPPEMFFPNDGVGTASAQKICRGCPVKEECLEYALATRQDHGVWGGASERERKDILKQRSRAK